MKIQPIFYSINKYTPRLNNTATPFKLTQSHDKFELSFNGNNDENLSFKEQCAKEIEQYSKYTPLTNEDKQNLLDICLKYPDFSEDDRLNMFDIGTQGNKFDIKKIYENLELQEIAKMHRNSLIGINDELSDSQLQTFFLINSKEISETKKLIGKDNLVYLFNFPLDKLTKDISICSDLSNPTNTHCLNPVDYESLIRLTNPKESEYYKSLQNQIDFKKKRLNDYKGENVVHFEKYAYTKIKEISQEIKTKDKVADKEEIKKLYQQIKDLKHDVNKTKRPFVIKKEKEISGLKQRIKLLEQNRIKDPNDVIRTIKMIANASGYENILLTLLNFDSDFKEDTLNNFIGNKILKKLKMPEHEEILEVLKLKNSPYLPELYAEDEFFYAQLKNLLSLIDFNDKETVAEQLNKLPQNIETRKQFENLGINYDKWSNFDPNSNVKIQLHPNSEKAKLDTVNNFTKNFTNQKFKDSIPEAYTKPLFKELKDQLGIEFRDDKFFKDGQPLKFEDIEPAIKVIKQHVNKNDYWFKETRDVSQNTVKRKFINDILSRQANEVKNINNPDFNKTVNIEVRKADMNDLSHSLFLGNHSACCVAIGGFNSPMAISYIKNKMAAAIEILDGKTAVGNTMCFISLIDGKPALYLDNIEILPKYQYNDEIRDAIFKYAHQLCKELGKENMPIYANTRSPKINMPQPDRNTHQIQLMGSTGDDLIYRDAKMESMKIDGYDWFYRPLYKIL